MTDYPFTPKRTPKPHPTGTESFIASNRALDLLTEWQVSVGQSVLNWEGRPGHRYRTCWRIVDAFYMRGFG